MVEIIESANLKRSLFGGEVEILVYNLDRHLAKKLLDQVYEEGVRLQGIFNLYDPKSELMQLNTIRKMRVSPDLLLVLKKALNMSKLTNGEYDVTLGKAILARKNGKTIEVKCSYRDIKIKEDEIDLTNSEVLIDLGSIAKGYIADKLSEFMISKGCKDFIIDARGDILVHGDLTHEFGIENPFNIMDDVGVVSLKNMAIATSGSYRQFAVSMDSSHILNQKDLISVSVAAKNAIDADLLASAVFTSSPEYRRTIIEQNPGVRVQTISIFGQHKMFNSFDKLLREKVYEK